MMEQNFINYCEKENIAILELDDPSANTLTYHLLKELEEKALYIASKSHIRGVVLIGKGDKFFSGGVNIGMLLTAGKQHNSHFILYAAEVLEFIENLTIPVVTIINGNITGGGLELALIADHRIAIKGDYNIGFPEVRLGVIPGMGGTQRLSRLVGPQRALEMITQGQFIAPEESKAIGLVDELLEIEGFREHAIEAAIHYISAQPFTERKDIGLGDKVKHILSEKLVTLDLQSGLAIIGVKQGSEKYSCIDVLLAINEFVLELRTDDSIFCVLIDIQAPSLGYNDITDLYPDHKIFTRYLFSKLSGYPRIVSLKVNRPLSKVEFELALHCDYRFIDQSTPLESIQPVNTDSEELPRYRTLFDKTDAINLSEFIDRGFFKVIENPQHWLMRFVPPTGAGQAIGYAKLAITKGYKEALSSSLLLERHLQEQLFMARDSKEGMKAYIEKRKPFFAGV
jgi:enoyl-CoA hydratase